MADPVTLSVLGGLAATEGIKFLYAQASELLKALRERRKAKAGDGPPDGPLEVPVEPNEILDGTATVAVVDVGVLEARQEELVRLAGALSPYALDLALVDLNDQALAEQAGELRALLEAAYGQRFTFRGEDREPTGIRISVKQVLGEVVGWVVGAEADVSGDAEVEVDQQVDKVDSDGTVTGFKGKLGP